MLIFVNNNRKPKWFRKGCTTHSWSLWQTDWQTDTMNIGNNSLRLMHSTAFIVQLLFVWLSVGFIALNKRRCVEWDVDKLQLLTYLHIDVSGVDGERQSRFSRCFQDESANDQLRKDVRCCCVWCPSCRPWRLCCKCCCSCSVLTRFCVINASDGYLVGNLQRI